MKNALDEKISSFEKAHGGDKKGLAEKVAASSGARAGYEFIIATLFFAGIGYVIDLQLGTLPWVALAFFFIGFATGVYNAWRVLNVSQEKVGFIQQRYRQKPAAENVENSEENADSTLPKE